MKIAVILCGRPRTFVFREQIIYFKRIKKQFPNADFFILLRIPEFKNSNIQKFVHGNPYIEHNIQTEQGLFNLKEQIDNLNPVYYEAFTNFEYENKECDYKVQWKMIDYLLNHVENYSKKNNFEYSYFIRLRLDWTDNNLYLTEELISNLDNNFIYRNYKNCEDLFFILSNNIYQNWWKNQIKSKLKIIKPNNNSLFENAKVKTIKMSDGGLLRDYKIISFWDNSKENFNFDLYWKHFNLKEYKLLNEILLDEEKYYKKLNLIFNNNYNFYLKY